ncbi:MAG: hypothetical protein AAF668_03935 [Pseudomonadota bacterium]
MPKADDLEDRASNDSDDIIQLDESSRVGDGSGGKTRGRRSRLAIQAISPVDGDEGVGGRRTSANDSGDDFLDRPTDAFDDPSLEDAVFRSATDWRRLSRDTMRASRICSVFIFAAMLTFWPVLTLVGHMNVVGTLTGWNIVAAYPTWAVIFTIIAPVTVYALGYIVSRQMLMMSAADALVVSAERMIEPDKTAVVNIQSVGAAVRGQIDAVNAGVDDALIRLSSVEAMIRQHVEAIEHAGVAMEGGAADTIEKVARERSTLMALTEQLNARADDFAVAIAEKAQASIDSLHHSNDLASDAEQRLEERLGRLEAVAQRAFTSFDALCNSLVSSGDRLSTAAEAIDRHAEETQKATETLNAVANEAADTAARNAVNIGQFAKKASDEAIKAAQDAIETAREQAERATGDAITTASAETERLSAAMLDAMEAMTGATDETVRTAIEDANRSIEAASTIAEAAKLTGEAARAASSSVEAAGAEASRVAEVASHASLSASDRVAERNRELAAARQELQAENERLENLIEEQRKRADRLAESIARQTERLSRLAEVQLREQEAAARLAEADAAKVAISGRTNDVDDTSDEGRLTLKSGQRRKGAKGAGGRPLGASSPKERVSWKEILTATDEAEPLDLKIAEATKKSGADPLGRSRAKATTEPSRDESDAVDMIRRLQNFTLNLERRLYGRPTNRLLAKFDAGDRNLFAVRLLNIEEVELKNRIQMEVDRDPSFLPALNQFLQGFEGLLEDTTDSETADDDLEQYLSSPLGRIYLVLGAAIGYFS